MRSSSGSDSGISRGTAGENQRAANRLARVEGTQQGAVERHLRRIGLRHTGFPLRHRCIGLEIDQQHLARRDGESVDNARHGTRPAADRHGAGDGHFRSRAGCESGGETRIGQRLQDIARNRGAFGPGEILGGQPSIAGGPPLAGVHLGQQLDQAVNGKALADRPCQRLFVTAEHWRSPGRRLGLARFDRSFPACRPRRTAKAGVARDRGRENASPDRTAAAAPAPLGRPRYRREGQRRMAAP